MTLPEIYENANREAEEDEMKATLLGSYMGEKCPPTIKVIDTNEATVKEMLCLLENVRNQSKFDGIKTGLKMAIEIAKLEKNWCSDIVKELQHKLNEMDK